MRLKGKIRENLVTKGHYSFVCNVYSERRRRESELHNLLIKERFNKVNRCIQRFEITSLI